LGRTVRELKDRSPFTYMHVDDISLVQARLLILSQTPGAVDTLEIRIQHADGSWRTLEAIGVNRLDDPVIRGIIVNSRDITERVQLEAALQRQALYDGLTGLPNRTLLEDRLRHALLAAKRESHPLALLLLDLDQFKDVNDTLGHQSGDLLLQQIGKRLSAAVRQSDTVARLGGDEFAILLPGTDVAGATLVARSVLSALEPMVLVDDQTLAVSGSIGLAVSPDHGTDEQTLLRHADIAMYTAKRARSGYSVYAAAADNGGADRLALLRGLRKVLAEGGLAMHYQPLVDFTTGRLTSVEALLRWSHAERGHIPPSEIIALAEQTSMIAPLTYWVLEEALRQCQEWQQTHNLQLNMAVNLSVRVLQDPQLLDTIVGLLGRYAIIPSRLTLEITESSLLVEEVQAVAVLRELAVIGVRLAIDDFGTGYASLDYLRRLPVREVKIDRSFVHGLGGSRNLADTAIVRSVIALAKALGLAVVAEGVETQAAWDLLRSLGCDEAQGYFVSRPLAVEDFLPWLQASLQSQPDLLL